MFVILDLNKTLSARLEVNRDGMETKDYNKSASIFTDDAVIFPSKHEKVVGRTGKYNVIREM